VTAVGWGGSRVGRRGVAVEVLLGVCGLLPFLLYGVGFIVAVVLFVKVLSDRLNNKEDDYYDKNVKQ
jgi:hypothetical protein